MIGDYDAFGSFDDVPLTPCPPRRSFKARPISQAGWVYIAAAVGLVLGPLVGGWLFISNLVW